MSPSTRKYRNTYDRIVNYNVCPKCGKRFRSTKVGVRKIHNISGLHVTFKCCDDTWYFWPDTTRLYLEMDNELVEAVVE